MSAGVVGPLLEEEAALCWCQRRHQPMERWHVGATVVGVPPPAAALFRFSVSFLHSSSVTNKNHTH